MKGRERGKKEKVAEVGGWGGDWERRGDEEKERNFHNTKSIIDFLSFFSFHMSSFKVQVLNGHLCEGRVCVCVFRSIWEGVPFG